MATPEDWKAKGQAKLASTNSKIPAAWRLPTDLLQDGGLTSARNVLAIPRESGLLTARELELTETYDATDLVQKLASGEVRAEELTIAFCKRAAIAQQLTSCLTEIFFEEAIERAKDLDAYLKREGKPIGPLHGLPISLKDCFNVKGQYATVGFVSFIDKPVADMNSVLPDILYKYGAVFYVKTNIPQTLMTGDSENNVFGRTLNPHKLFLGAGGSSGGEGALIAQRGSVLGLGTDIGGSIRIPAFVNGIYGFKGTVGRLPYAGQQQFTRKGRTGIAPCAGPLGVSLRDLEMIFKLVSAADPWLYDEGVISVPWRDLPPPTQDKKLRFGVITEDPKSPIHPPMLRALKTATKALAAAGNILVPLDRQIPSLYDGFILASKAFMTDNKMTPFQHMAASGEPPIPSIATLQMEEMKDWQISLDEMWEINAEREQVRTSWRKLWAENSLDAVVMVPHAGTAQRHDKYGLPPYTVVANVLDYPAAVIPFLKASKELDAPYVRNGGAFVNRRPEYDPEACEGMPCAIQLLGRPMHEEELMQHLKTVDIILKTAA
ncbi:amidase [Viridothelium virens]|uniref:amidase n=1 Tax=Viridothelium virens TaxID=1048519 RepID=A0A6A6HI85_VIRVR|nr:amidase [Viridothelium virens]